MLKWCLLSRSWHIEISDAALFATPRQNAFKIKNNSELCFRNSLSGFSFREMKLCGRQIK